MSQDFEINDCNDYVGAPPQKYKLMAEKDELLRLIYDYFTDQVKGYNENEIRQAITSAIWSL